MLTCFPPQSPVPLPVPFPFPFPDSSRIRGHSLCLCPPLLSTLCAVVPVHPSFRLSSGLLPPRWQHEVLKVLCGTGRASFALPLPALVAAAIVVKLNWMRRRLSHAIFHSVIQQQVEYAVLLRQSWEIIKSSSGTYSSLSQAHSLSLSLSLPLSLSLTLRWLCAHAISLTHYLPINL